MARKPAYSIESNPFYVLDLPVTSTRMEVERQGQKLLAMLELEIDAGKMFATPLGPRQRTPDLVRQALAELRDPRKRLVHELWHVGEELIETPDVEPVNDSKQSGWDGALSMHGWSVVK